MKFKDVLKSVETVLDKVNQQDFEHEASVSGPAGEISVRINWRDFKFQNAQIVKDKTQTFLIKKMAVGFDPETIDKELGTHLGNDLFYNNYRITILSMRVSEGTKTDSRDEPPPIDGIVFG